MKEIILLKSGEIALKGLNRSTFEDIMAKNARRRLQPLGEFKIWHAQSPPMCSPSPRAWTWMRRFAACRRYSALWP